MKNSGTLLASISPCHISLSSLRRTLFVILAFLAATPVANASVIGLTFTGGPSYPGWDGKPSTIGWLFNVNTVVTVEALGFYDYSSGPLQREHQVGIWTDAGVLLASTTVLTNDPLISEFRFHDIAHVQLGIGSYRIGAWIDGISDRYKTYVDEIVTDPRITHTGDTRSGSDTGFEFPNLPSTNDGRFGPNLLLSSASIPEPTTLALMGLGLAGIGLRRRKVKTKL